MCMLTKRTNILFDAALWQTLTSVAKAKRTSIGKLVREAVKEKYTEDEVLRKRNQAFENILKLRPKPYPGKIDYKALINEGRKVY